MLANATFLPSEICANVPASSRASSLPQFMCLLREAELDSHRYRGFPGTTVPRANSFAKAMAQTTNTWSHARAQESRSAIRPPRTLLILILGAPLNHAGRNSILRRGASRQGCRFSRAGPGMALRGGPTHHCRITGIPSTSEGPSGGARAFCLLLTGPAFRLFKSEAL